MELRFGRRDLERVYGAIFLTAVSAFEALLEELFLGLLGRTIGPSRNVRPRAVFRSTVAVRRIVFAGRNYADWLPYNKYTSPRAKLFFAEGRPFTELPEGDLQTLAKVVKIRNALAHASRYALATFRDEVVSNIPLLPEEKSPAGFLRSALRVAPVQTRYEQLAAELSSVAYKICR